MSYNPYPATKPVLPKPDRCKVCGRRDASYATRLNGRGKRYYRTTCTTCLGRQDRQGWSKERRAEHNRKRRMAMRALKMSDPVKHHQIKRGTWLKSFFGITLAEYEKMFREQGSVCAICGLDNRKDKRFLSMPVDHDHTTGKIRGILCLSCNTMLGAAKDNKQTLLKATEYLDGQL